jgi:hypothetical protein
MFSATGNRSEFCFIPMMSDGLPLRAYQKPSSPPVWLLHKCSVDEIAPLRETDHANRSTGVHSSRTELQAKRSALAALVVGEDAELPQFAGGTMDGFKAERMCRSPLKEVSERVEDALMNRAPDALLERTQGSRGRMLRSG